MGDFMGEQLAFAAAYLNVAEGIPVHFSDPRPNFAGHGACTSDNKINELILTKTEGEDPNGGLWSQQSLHPNLGGTTLYADTLNSTLRQLGL
jgi:hypothetical protein